MARSPRLMAFSKQGCCSIGAHPQLAVVQVALLLQHVSVNRGGRYGGRARRNRSVATVRTGIQGQGNHAAYRLRRHRGSGRVAARSV